jgi:hypothetical protein
VLFGAFSLLTLPTLSTNSGICAISVSGNNTSAHFYLGNGAGGFQTSSSLFTGWSPVKIAVGDFKGDGTSNLAITNGRANSDGLGSANSLSIINNQVISTATATLAGVSVPVGGIHNVDAYFSGNANYAASNSGTVSLNGSPILTGLTLSVAPNSSIYGQQIALSANLSPSSLGGLQTDSEPIGFFNNGSSLGTGSLATGVATIQTTSWDARPLLYQLR